MENLDQEIINWLQFAKGDVPGHAFHGNQWASEAGITDAMKNGVRFSHAGQDYTFPAGNADASKAADWSYDNADRIQPNESSLRGVANLHQEIADVHAGDTHYVDGNGPNADEHFIDTDNAVSAHQSVADYANHLADAVASGQQVQPEKIAQLKSEIGSASDESGFIPIHD